MIRKLRAVIPIKVSEPEPVFEPGTQWLKRLSPQEEEPYNTIGNEHSNDSPIPP